MAPTKEIETVHGKCLKFSEFRRLNTYDELLGHLSSVRSFFWELKSNITNKHKEIHILKLVSQLFLCF
jgi:hypothetical protein